MSPGNSVLRHSLTPLAALALFACADPSTPATSETEQHLCPDGPCGKPPKDDPNDPPPPATNYYPANGWTVFNASETNVMRGVQWWAYAWDGNQLNVKGYYPQEFGTGIAVGSEPAHVFLRINVTSLTDWTVSSRLELPTYAPWGEFYIVYANAFIQNFMTEDGVAKQIASVISSDCIGDICTTHERYGIYEDDGTGVAFTQGTEDVLQESAAYAAMAFMNDFSSTGATLLPPGIAFDNPCYDEECSNSPIKKYLDRRAQFLADGTSPACRVGSMGMFVCAGGMILSIFFPPALPFAIGTCTGAVLAALPCLDEKINGRSSQGACATNFGPTTVTGPDGNSAIVTSQTVGRQNCDI